jgi:hypothetical protein
MRLKFIPVTILLLFAMSLPASAQWEWGRPQRPKAGACFYRADHYRGDYFCMRVEDRWPSMPRGFNDEIKSIRVFGGARLRVFNDDNFHGVSLLVDRDIDDLRRVPVADNFHKNWDNRISSIAVFRDRDEWREHDRDQDRR